MSKIKLLTTKQLRQKTVKELQQLLAGIRVQKEQNRMAISTKRSKNTNLLHKDRLTIARIKTILAEKKDLAKLAVVSETKPKKN